MNTFEIISLIVSTATVSISLLIALVDTLNKNRAAAELAARAAARKAERNS